MQDFALPSFFGVDTLSMLQQQHRRGKHVEMLTVTVEILRSLGGVQCNAKEKFFCARTEVTSQDETYFEKSIIPPIDGSRPRMLFTVAH